MQRWTFVNVLHLYYKGNSYILLGQIDEMHIYGMKCVIIGIKFNLKTIVIVQKQAIYFLFSGFIIPYFIPLWYVPIEWEDF